MMELYYGDQPNYIETAIQEHGTELISAAGRSIMENYVEWAATHDDFEPITQEQDYVVPLYDDVSFAGRWDMVVERQGKIWINDYKITGADFGRYTEYLANHDEQARAYSWAGKKIYGDDFGGIMFTLVRNKGPEQPERLKRGGISRNKMQTTTWALYRKAVIEAGENPADYSEMEELFLGKPYIVRTFIQLGQRTLDAFEKRAIHTARQMLNPKVHLYPNASVMNCGMCSYKFPCQVWHSIGASAAKQILLTDYAQSKYTTDAADEDKFTAMTPYASE